MLNVVFCDVVIILIYFEYLIFIGANLRINFQIQKKKDKK